jgi:hypothetical protein
MGDVLKFPRPTARQLFVFRENPDPRCRHGRSAYARGFAVRSACIATAPRCARAS